jgi:hypothetical protein
VSVSLGTEAPPSEVYFPQGRDDEGYLRRIDRFSRPRIIPEEGGGARRLKALERSGSKELRRPGLGVALNSMHNDYIQ